MWKTIFTAFTTFTVGWVWPHICCSWHTLYISSSGPFCKNAKRYFTVEAASYGIAFLLCMAHVYNTAGVLRRRPNASIYLSAILAGIYYLVRIRRYPDQTAPTTLQHAKQ